MNPQLNKKDTKTDRVILTSYRAINSDQVRGNDKAKEGQVMMKRDRGIIRKAIISRRDTDEVMTEEGGKGNAPGIRHGYG